MWNSELLLFMNIALPNNRLLNENPKQWSLEYYIIFLCFLHENFIREYRNIHKVTIEPNHDVKAFSREDGLNLDAYTCN